MNKRDVYAQKLKARLDQWKAEIDRMNAGADRLEADARIEFRKQMERLQARREEASRSLEDLGKAAEGSWEDLREGMERAWGELDRAIREAASRFR